LDFRWKFTRTARGGSRLWNSNSSISFWRRNTPSSYTNATEEYNGINLDRWRKFSNNKKTFSRCGTQTAGLAFGGEVHQTDSTEEYNGTSWTAGGPLPSARAEVGGAGISTNCRLGL
jgi:hypothetical protein